MAQIVLIDVGTVRLDENGNPTNKVGDVVAIHDDRTALTGPGYDNFKILKVDMTVEEAQQAINALQPEVKRAFKTAAVPGEWSFDRPEECEMWNDNGTWRKIEERPKYSVNLANISDVDLTTLNDTQASIGLKIATIATKGESNLAVAEVNKIAVAELNVKAIEEAPIEEAPIEAVKEAL